jgi:hypothetical protein
MRLQQQQQPPRTLEEGGAAGIEGGAQDRLEGCGCEFDGMQSVYLSAFWLNLDGAPPRDDWR